MVLLVEKYLQFVHNPFIPINIIICIFYKFFDSDNMLILKNCFS